MGHKVLLADDSITVQKIVKLSLTEEGIEVIALGNGEQAVQQLESLQPDLVMADVFMPGKDGYEVCEFVKSHPQFKNIPVILLVHAFEPFDPDRAKKVGADHQLTKPFQSIRTLVTTVKDLLQSQETAQTQTPPLETLNQPSPLSASVATFPPSSAHTQFGEVLPTIPVLATATSFQSETVSETSDFPSFPSPSSTAVSFAQTESIPLPEPGFPIPLTSANSMLQADMLPPTELSVFGQSNWQTDSPLQEQETIVSQVEATQVEGGVASFAHISASATQATPLAFSEDVLELSDVLTSDSDIAGISNDTVVSSLNSLSSDVPLLAVLGSSPTNQEIPSNPFETTFTPQPANTGGAYDLAVGQVTSPTNPQLNTDSIVQQDVSLGAVNKFDGITAQQIPEALIEEIVNRVVQRLSTNAIQEIAWEVVPEMAELLIRKQISQQKQLAH